MMSSSSSSPLSIPVNASTSSSVDTSSSSTTIDNTANSNISSTSPLSTPIADTIPSSSFSSSSSSSSSTSSLSSSSSSSSSSRVPGLTIGDFHQMSLYHSISPSERNSIITAYTVALADSQLTPIRSLSPAGVQTVLNAMTYEDYSVITKLAHVVWCAKVEGEKCRADATRERGMFIMRRMRDDQGGMDGVTMVILARLLTDNDITFVTRYAGIVVTFRNEDDE